ncbi:Nucleoside-diphosphate-sugar epimerase [Nitrosomonas sp. Nm51]|uniref:vitamin K epoxide reductase family protein n=1 Tax=Nitrosomonas sp. Nm51 TaxID=133720 RepID=UPI0008BFE295|nr:vitamin K epoxide reductase family protein [Nitrosomonas sp. Nm51]SEQ98461.1 Nucleoside-diphosphate-sugar epimerase [Nitrosomonas sp. Nm51]
MSSRQKPIVIVTGASGNIGEALSESLKQKYRVVGLDINSCKEADTSIECNLTSDDSVKSALDAVRAQHGEKIAAVIHLAAYFDFTGEHHPLYQEVTVDGTRRLLKFLQSFEIERFIYASTMLVHEPTVPGQKIDENTPLKPAWAYPQSKAEAEEVIRQQHGQIPYTILRLAGVYDDDSAVPTLTYQISRIYQRDFKSHLYAGDLMAGQAFIHKEDMVALFQKVVDRRKKLPDTNIILAGENEVMGYRELQNRIGYLIFGKKEWQTIDMPEFLAKSGAWLEEKAEPIIPDEIDQGEKPFIKPFMIDLASDHYDLDIGRAQELLDWQPKHRIYDGLKNIIASLKKDPAAWYKKNRITEPDWMRAAQEKHKNADRIREKHEASYRRQHHENIWAHFLNMGLGCWLITAPFTLGYESQAMIWSDIVSGFVLLVLSFVSLSWRFGLARWLCGGVGLWLLGAPLIFWAPTAAAYLNDTIVGMLAMGFAVLTRPVPGVSPVAAQTGPTIPPGWTYSPSSWFQRLPIIILAFIGFFISRYLCAYQLGHIDSVWEPFFPGALQDPKNGTEEVITSSVSKAWPVPDAGLGAMTYALEILTGIMGSSRRWRTMPWLVMLFGILIVPLGIVSIFFIIIQPILIGTWCTLCLIAAAAMLIQIPYSLDELIATSEFLYRRKKQGHSLLRVFFQGDTDEGKWETVEDSFAQKPSFIIKEMLGGGVTLPWNLVLCIPIGVWLMFTRVTLGNEGGMANADHLIGSLVLTVVITALAESGRAFRFFILPLGTALLVTPFFYDTSTLSLTSSMVCGLLLIGLCLPRGTIYNEYGDWRRFIV